MGAVGWERCERDALLVPGYGFGPCSVVGVEELDEGGIVDGTVAVGGGGRCVACVPEGCWEGDVDFL